MGVLAAIALAAGLIALIGGGDEEGERHARACDPERPFEREPPGGLAYYAASPERTEEAVGLMRSGGIEDVVEDDVAVRQVRGSGRYALATIIRLPRGIEGFDVQAWLRAGVAEDDVDAELERIDVGGRSGTLASVEIESRPLSAVFVLSGCRMVVAQAFDEATARRTAAGLIDPP